MWLETHCGVYRYSHHHHRHHLVRSVLGERDVVEICSGNLCKLMAS